MEFFGGWTRDKQQRHGALYDETTPIKLGSARQIVVDSHAFPNKSTGWGSMGMIKNQVGDLTVAPGQFACGGECEEI
jgi:hypothetical protein